MIDVLIDSGHGGSNRGYKRDGFVEAVANRRVAEDLVWLAAGLGVNTQRTTDGDEDTSFLQRSIHSPYSDLAISIHHNANRSPSSHGAEMYVRPDDYAAYKVARCIAEAMPKQLRTGKVIRTNVDNGEWLERPLNVMEDYDCPIVLVECGYASNDTDLHYMTSMQGRGAIISAILQGILYHWCTKGLVHD